MLCVFVALGACAAFVASACDTGNPAFDGLRARDASSFSGDAGVAVCAEDAGTCQHEGGYSAAAEPPSFATGTLSSLVEFPAAGVITTSNGSFVFFDADGLTPFDLINTPAIANVAMYRPDGLLSFGDGGFPDYVVKSRDTEGLGQSALTVNGVELVKTP